MAKDLGGGVGAQSFNLRGGDDHEGKKRGKSLCSATSSTSRQKKHQLKP